MTNKKAFITGTSTGIGEAISDYLCANGWLVIGTVRKLEDAAVLKKKYADSFFPLVYDVRDWAGLQAIVIAVNKITGNASLDLLVNNAGIAIAGPLEELSNDDFEKQLDVNVKSVFRITNAFIPFLIANGKAQIINIGSVSGLFTSPFLGAYSISKHALESMSDAYRRELLPFGVDVFCLEPGPIKTPIWIKTKGVFSKFQHSRYAPYLKKVENSSISSIKKAKPVEEVVKIVAKIVNNKAKKARYIIASNKFFFYFLRHVLPDRFIDNQIKRKIYS